MFTKTFHLVYASAVFTALLLAVPEAEARSSSYKNNSNYFNYTWDNYKVQGSHHQSSAYKPRWRRASSSDYWAAGSKGRVPDTQFTYYKWEGHKVRQPASHRYSYSSSGGGHSSSYSPNRGSNQTIKAQTKPSRPPSGNYGRAINRKMYTRR